MTDREADGYPRVVACGAPRELGRQYGRAARERIGRSIEAYTAVFDYYAHMSWAEARRKAQAFVPAIGAYDGRCLTQLDGMAEGAGLEFDDLLALNLRSEVMFGCAPHGSSALHRPSGEDAAATPPPNPGECTAVVALPEATDDGHTLLAQNWDWLIHTRDTTIVLEARPDDGPAYVTVVEAGLLAKTGMNANGVGVVTNTLVSDLDAAEPVVPYHVILRSLHESESVADALSRLYRATRSSSANFFVASGDGLADGRRVPSRRTGERARRPARRGPRGARQPLRVAALHGRGHRPPDRAGQSLPPRPPDVVAEKERGAGQQVAPADGVHRPRRSPLRRLQSTRTRGRSSWISTRPSPRSSWT